jgi:ankyrin repeat protein
MKARKSDSLEELLLAISDVLVLEDRAISVTEIGYCGDTPLHVAAIWGDVQAIDMLVLAGADLDAPGEFHFTPLRHAVGQGHVEAARRLLELGASTQTRGDWGRTPEELARSPESPRMIALFDEYSGR